MPATPALPFLPDIAGHPALDSAPALCDDAGEWISYGDLRARIRGLSNGFAAETRQLIFCCAPRSIDGALSYLAAAASGHAVALMDGASPHLEKFIAAYRPDWIIASAGHFTGYGPVEWPCQNLRLWKRNAPGKDTLHPDFYLLLLTSGSTGNSKGVRLSYSNIASNTRAIIESLGLGPDQRAFLHLPLHYSFGLSVLHTQLAVGGSCVLTGHGMMSRAFWQRARAAKANLFPGAPYHYEMLAKLGLDRLDAPDLDMFLQAGGKMREDLARALLQHIKKRHGRFFILYGQTEASPRISCLPVHEHPDKIGTCGRVLPGGKLSIENGEIIYSGPNVMMGHAETRADLARGDERDGRLATGDAGSIDSGGYLTITGRTQRFAKLFGQRISLDDLEKIAEQIAPAIAVETGEKIILATTDHGNAEILRMHVANETGLPPTWLETRVIDALPHSANGKVDYDRLKELL